MSQNDNPILFSPGMVRSIIDGRKTKTRRVVKPQPAGQLRNYGHGYWSDSEESGEAYTRCPYGSPGDRLWVRETWGRRSDGKVYYLADQQLGSVDVDKWRPSIHMPRWASRLTLEVVDVQVERLHDITEEDAFAEGVPSDGSLVATEDRLCARAKALNLPATDSRVSFAELWDNINGKRAPWDTNPWLWVVEFKILSIGQAGKATA